MDTTVRVQTIGVRPSWIQHGPPPEIRHQLFLAHNVREDLVTLQHHYEEQVRKIWSSYPSVAATEERVVAADEAAAAAAEKVKQQRIEQRTKHITGPAPGKLLEAKATLRQARAERREAIAAVRDDAQERLRAASDEIRAAQKQLYRDYCTNGDLYWATFNLVLDHHKAAIKRVQQIRNQGRPATLRHHRFDGTGTIAVQLQRAKGMPPRTPATLADTDRGRWRSSITIPWVDPDTYNTLTRGEQKRAGRGIVRMRCGSRDDEPVWVEIPVQQHQMLPADADITMVQLTVRRTADLYRGQLAVTAKLPDHAEAPDSGPTIAIHLGWRRDDTTNGIVVAHWRATEPLTILPSLRGIIDPDPGRTTGRIILPPNIAEQIRYADQLQSTRDMTFTAIRDKFADWLDEEGPIPHPTKDDSTLTSADVRKWRSPAHLVTLVNGRAKHPIDTTQPHTAAMYDTIKDWAGSDKPLWRTQEHSRRKASRRRLDTYRRVAAALVDQAAAIIVDDSDITAGATRQVEKSDLPNDMVHAIANRRITTAPGELRASITATATREQVPITTVDSTHISRTCPHCGHINDADPFATTTCADCQRTYNRASAATQTMLKRAHTTDTPTP